MSLFVEGSEQSKIASTPISNDNEEEKQKSQYLHDSMIWMNDVKERAILEARRLRLRYDSIPPEKIIENLTDEEYCYLYDILTPWKYNGNNHLKYQLFGVIMHHGSAYSGHYSAYIRDCLGEGNWKAPTSSSSSSYNNNNNNKSNNDSNSGGSNSNIEIPNDLCYIMPRPGQTFVKEESPLNVVLSIVHSSTDGPTTTVGRNQRHVAVINHSGQPSIEVIIFNNFIILFLFIYFFN